jgi:hypothetical protein
MVRAASDRAEERVTYITTALLSMKLPELPSEISITAGEDWMVGEATRTDDGRCLVIG